MATTIMISTAAEQLGLSENQLRDLLAPIYSNAATVKRISQKSFKTIAEELHTRAIDANPDVDVDELEQSIEKEIATGQVTLLQESEDDFIDTQESDDSEVDQDTESALSTLPEQEIAVRVRQVLDTNPNLKQQTLDLSRITRTVALLASDKAVEDFQAIYAARFNQGISAFINDFSQTALTTITEIQNQKVTDFFEELDLNYSSANNQATDQLKELMALYQSPIQ